MPKDFRNKNFQKILRGYAPEEVDDYIAYINEEYRKLERAKNDSDRKLALALTRLDALNAKLDANHSDVSDEARNDAGLIIADAEKEAEKIIADAKIRAAEEVKLAAAESAGEAERILAEAEERAGHINAEAARVAKAAVGMYDEVCSFRDSLFELYNTHIESIEEMTVYAKNYIGRIDPEYETEEEEDTAEEYPDNEYSDNKYPEDIDEIDNIGMIAEYDRIDVSDGDAEEDFETENTDDIPFEADSDYEDEASGGEDTLQIDWKNRRVVINDDYDDEEEDGQFADEDDADELDADAAIKAELTRVLNLGAIRQAPGAGTLMIDLDDYAEEDFENLDDDFEKIDEGGEDGSDEISDFEDDFEDGDTDTEGHEFGNIDALFSKQQKKADLSLTDEFDIVFANSDSKRNVEEIRRQPTIVPEDNTKKKKHIKF